MLVALALVGAVAWSAAASLGALCGCRWPAALSCEGWRAVRVWRAAKREVWSFLTSTCALAIWHSLAVLVRFSSVEDVDYPGAFKWLMRIYALVTFDLAAWLPTPCAGWSYYHTLLMATLLPLYLVLVVALVSLCSRDPDAKQRACRRLAVLLIMCHATVCSVLFEFFHLDGVEYHTADERGFRTSATERELYLARDYTIRASSKRYQAYRAYAILCCLIYVVGLPGLFFTVLLLEQVRQRRATFGSCVDCEALSDILRPTPLVRPYRKGAWFAEPLSMVVRTSLSGFLLVCLPGARRMRLVLSFVISLLYALAIADGEPFQSPAVNTVAHTSWFFVTSTFFMALCCTQKTLKLEQLRIVSGALVAAQVFVLVLAVRRYAYEKPIRTLCARIRRRPVHTSNRRGASRHRRAPNSLIDLRTGAACARRTSASSSRRSARRAASTSSRARPSRPSWTATSGTSPGATRTPTRSGGGSAARYAPCTRSVLCGNQNIKAPLTASAR